MECLHYGLRSQYHAQYNLEMGMKYAGTVKMAFAICIVWRPDFSV